MMKSIGTWFAKNALVLIIGGLIVFLVFAKINDWREAREAKITSNVADATIQAGKAAVDTIAQGAERETHIIERERVINNVIREAEGASNVVPRPVHDAGIAGLCNYGTYNRTERCLQLANPSSLEE
jgi:hypothetical protein